MSRIGFFATRCDLTDLLTDIESSRDIRYIEAGMFDEDKSAIYRTAAEIPKLGEIDILDPNQGDIFLIADSDVRFSMRTVPQRRGGVRYALDQRDNPNTISLVPGGHFEDQIVVAGNFGTCTDSSASRTLMNLVRRVIKRRWAKIKSDFVGPEAEHILDSGGRLTAGLRPEFDLQR